MKKTLCILLALALVLGLAACGGGEPAASELPDPELSLPPEDATPSDLTPEASPTPTPTPESIDTLKVCGISIITNGQLTGLAFKGVKYENGVLLLDSAVLDSGTTSDILIEFYGGDLEVEVTGECVFTSAGVSSIIGDGSLSLKGTEAAAISVEGSVTAACALNVTGAPAAESAGVSAGEGFSLSENSENSIVVAAAA